ncbi:Spy/CpxP family protein refolding chaperone [Halomonas sp. Bachu 37]|uniref:Spy/CpxP family protein refolding chaperone n=1 Tax=Halomonas kashgarensis TaxID=3084920 RepID=UPI003216EBB7
MKIRKHTLALGLVLVLGANGTGVALAQGMPDSQPGQGMMNSQGGMGSGMMSGMMNGQGGMGSGMMDEMMGGMGPGMMKGMMGGEMMPCPMMGGSGMGMMQEMLDPEQREQLRELMQEHRPAQLERLGRMMNQREDLMAEMQSDRPDPDEVKTLHGRLAELRGEMLVEHVRHHNAMNDLLSDEQRQQLEEAVPSATDPDDHDAHH